MNTEHPYSVLIVDDSDLDRHILVRFLKKTDLSLVILEASGGEEALDLLTSPRDQIEARYPGVSGPVTLFLDINMPIMNGWEFLETLETKQDEIKIKPAIVLMHSTSNTGWEKQKAFGFELVADYVVKGEYTPEQLKTSILACHNENK